MGLVLAPLLAVGVAAEARAGGPTMDIAGVMLQMRAGKVVDKLGQPRARTRSGKAIAWRYPDRLVVYLRRKRPAAPRRVVGVRTRSPKDRMTVFRGVHVGAPARRVRERRIGSQCFTAAIDDPTSRRRAGRYCTWPTYMDFDEETEEVKPDLDVKAPVWVFRIVDKRIASVTLQVQPRRHQP